jgi:hypothetical protein
VVVSSAGDLRTFEKLTSRLYVKEFEEVVPYRSEYGSGHRRQAGCLGRLSQSTQSGTM